MNTQETHAFLHELRAKLVAVVATIMLLVAALGLASSLPAEAVPGPDECPTEHTANERSSARSDRSQGRSQAADPDCDPPPDDIIIQYFGPDEDDGETDADDADGSSGT